MTITAKERIDILQDVSQLFAAIMFSINQSREKIPPGAVDVKAELHEVTSNMQCALISLSDLIDAERMAMEQKNTQLTRRLAVTQGNSRQQREAPDPRSTETALDEIEKQMLAEGEIVERVSCMLASASQNIIKELLETREQLTEKIDKIDQKFTGLGKALDVIAKATQKPAARSGNNGDET